MTRLKIGDNAPVFHTLASNGENICLKDFKGKKNIVLYFYPKDDTPGCTLEACGFRDSIQSITSEDTIVMGVSPDNLKSHEKFIAKFQLPFLLLSDEDKTMCEEYGVWVEKSMYGRTYMGVERTTFVINKAGKIAHIFQKVKPRGHEKEVLKVLKNLI